MASSRWSLGSDRGAAKVLRKSMCGAGGAVVFVGVAAALSGRCDGGRFAAGGLGRCLREGWIVGVTGVQGWLTSTEGE
ncbi:MAG: hypothetical protein AAF471_09200 [Myxococcota bacterium]